MERAHRCDTGALLGLLPRRLPTDTAGPATPRSQSKHYAPAATGRWRMDCLGDMGGFSKTWSHMDDYYPQTLIQTGMQDAWRRAPHDGGVLGDATLEEPGLGHRPHHQRIAKWHISSFNAKSSPVPSEWRPQVNRWLKHMGYRFVLRRLTYPEAVKPGDQFAFTHGG